MIGAAPRLALVPLWPLALACALLPFATIHAAFLVSAVEEHVAWCVPYWDGCSSISRAGRYGTAYFVFKGGMIPASTLLVFYWLFNRAWLRQLHLGGGTALPWLGLVASLALLVYTLVLGHAGDTFQTLRRMGVILFFGLTWLAQLQLGARLRWHPRFAAAGRRLFGLSLFALGAGLASLCAGLLVPEQHDGLEDAFEWIMALLLNVHVLVVTLLWRSSGFHVYGALRP
jgi:hypothetical protein